jgi:Arc/MetJ family transcription regulator
LIKETFVRITIDIDDKLLQDVMKGLRIRTKREAVHQGLASLKRWLAYRRLLDLGGKLRWRGNLDVRRLDLPATNLVLAPRQKGRRKRYNSKSTAERY